METRWARVLRGLIAACTATFVAAFFHTAAGGVAPGFLGVTVTVIVAMPAAVFLAGRSRSWTRLALSVAASQFLFHLTLGLGSRTVAGASARHAGHVPAVEPASTLDVSSAASVGAFDATLTMWPAHLLAVLLTIVALGHGEAAFWGLLALTGLTIAGSLVAPPTPSLRGVHGAIAVAPSALSIPSSLAALSPMRRRGPPCAFA